MPSVWSGESWRLEVEDWIRTEVVEAGLELTGPIEQHRIRMWSTQLTVPTSRGRLWFKENHPAQRSEAAVIDELGRLAPGHVVIPLAVDRSRGWLLTPDHGATLATLSGSDEQQWVRVVSEYADLQRRVRGHREELAAAGLPRFTPDLVPGHLEHAVTQMRTLHRADPLHLPGELADRVLEAVPKLRHVADLLHSCGPPLESLEHNDLHPNNTFIPRADETTLRFFDFGDALWAHPFTTMWLPVRMLCREWGVDATDRRVRRVVDGYLETWSDIGSLDELREIAALALVFGPVHRFETWHRLLADNPPGSNLDQAANMRFWLTQVAETSIPSAVHR